MPKPVRMHLNNSSALYFALQQLDETRAKFMRSHFFLFFCFDQANKYTLTSRSNDWKFDKQYIIERYTVQQQTR